jgi:hypothetical protein
MTNIGGTIHEPNPSLQLAGSCFCAAGVYGRGIGIRSYGYCLARFRSGADFTHGIGTKSYVLVYWTNSANLRA